jgi:hypothetical protein
MFLIPHSRNLQLLLLTTLISMGLPTTSWTACADYELPMNQAVQAYDLDSLEKLLVTLNKQSDCPNTYLESIKRSMAQIAAAKADSLTQQKQLDDAEMWLKRAPVILWVTQVIRGDIAAHRQQWYTASQFYQQALDLINSPETTPPPEAVVEKIHHLASDTYRKAQQ